MLWTAPPPARRCHGRRGVTRFGGLGHASCDDGWSRHCKVGFSGPWRRRRRQCGRPTQGEAPVHRCFLPEAAAVSRWYRGLRIIASLGARTPGTGPYRAPDAANLRQALCEAAHAVNLKTAKALGLTIPPGVLAIADPTRSPRPPIS